MIHIWCFNHTVEFNGNILCIIKEDMVTIVAWLNGSQKIQDDA